MTACVDCGDDTRAGYFYGDDDQPRCRDCHDGGRVPKARSRTPLDEYTAHDAARSRMRVVENGVSGR